jgi:predicted nucleic acid-binding protein
MPAYYLDTSALVKRYVIEAGSAWVHQVADPSRRNGLYTSRLTAVELTAAVVRRARGAGIPSADLQATLAAFRGDWSTEYRVVEVTVALVDRAVALAEQFAVRGYDAMHVATALAVNDVMLAQGQPALIFVSAEREQTAAATAAGLASIDPTTTP